MIKQIAVKNFKCFDKLVLPVRNVNVFTGINGMGKSTVIQAMLLLRQSYLRDNVMNGLCLNGRYVSLGEAQDVLYEKAVDEVLELGYSADDKEYNFQYGYIQNSDFLPIINKVECDYERDIFGNKFSYLSAFRVEPKVLYSINNEDEIKNREFGNNGEFAFQYLSIHGNDAVENEHVLLEDKLGNSLMNQTRLWMDKVSPGVSPKVTLNMQLRASEVKYEFIEGKEKTNSYKSMNVGFGITYVLPLIIAILSAKKGDIIVIENPEAHLHPAGQSMLGELIARAGMGGVQLFVETHSDHLMNGIRMAVKKKIIDRELVQIDFFYKDNEDEYKHKYVSPEIKEDGRLDIWPEGFFDEWDKALYELI